jgi:hypothetical protein
MKVLRRPEEAELMKLARDPDGNLAGDLLKEEEVQSMEGKH